MVLLVTYDLHGHHEHRDYERVHKTLREAGGDVVHLQGSVWLVDTTDEPATWRDRLRAVAHRDDECLVIRLEQQWATFRPEGKGGEAMDWLDSPERNW